MNSADDSCEKVLEREGLCIELPPSISSGNIDERNAFEFVCRAPNCWHEEKKVCVSKSAIRKEMCDKLEDSRMNWFDGPIREYTRVSVASEMKERKPASEMKDESFANSWKMTLIVVVLAITMLY